MPDDWIGRPHLMETPPAGYARPLIGLDEGRDRFKQTATAFLKTSRQDMADDPTPEG